MMGERRFTTEHERCLRNQVVSADEPGSVLQDFEMLLEFLRLQGGVLASGTYNLLPLKFIGDLDRRLTRPLHLQTKRPQLKSHPYLQGLHLLLRASGLSRVDGAGARARLVVDPAMEDQWRQLNSTERYFNLMEAWLRFGRGEMVGERPDFWSGLLQPCLQAWRPIPAEGVQFDIDRPTEVCIDGIYRSFYQLGLLDLFGIVQVERPSRPVAPWCPAGIKRVPFGDAVFTRIATRMDVLGREAQVRDEHATDDRRFGAWQPLFQPYFPDWRASLELPRSEFGEGTYIFRVSIGKMWRIIAIPADHTLDDLLLWVLRSVNFDSDHLYRFSYRNRMGTTVRINDSRIGEGPTTDQAKIGTLPLAPGQTMDLLYDFGDNWEFTITLERVEPPGSRIKAPRIMEKRGESPEQYPRWDE
jgi:Plasmid pRiA4b ORF-3-like protein